jgi:hypothetical protein
MHESRYKTDIVDKILPGHTKICSALWWGIISPKFSQTLKARGPRVADHWCTIRVYRVLRLWNDTESITCSLTPIAACIALEIIQNTCDAQSQTLVMHNHKLSCCTITHKFPSCTITNSRTAQSPTHVMHNYRSESLTHTEIYLNILYHPNPHYDILTIWDYYTFMQAKYSRLERVLEGDSRYLQPPELEIDDLWEGLRVHKGEFRQSLYSQFLFYKYERLTIWRLVASMRTAGPIITTFAFSPTLSLIYVHHMFKD